MIQTAGYDIFAQIHEKAINEALAVAFYSGKVCINGDYSIAEKIPSQFSPFSQFKYEIRLTNEPFVDFRSSDRVFLQFGSQLKINLFDCVDVFFSLNFNIQTDVHFDIDHQKLLLKLKKANIVKLSIQNEYYVGKSFLNKFNLIIDEILNAYFKNELKAIDLPFNLNESGLPLSIQQCHVRIFDNKSIVLGLSFFQAEGSLKNAQNCLNGEDYYVAVSEKAALNIFDFWWNHSQPKITTNFDEQANANFLSGTIAKGTDILTRVVTLGFLQTETDYDNMILKCKGSVSVNKQPSINFCESGGIEILDLEFDANVNVQIEADEIKTKYLDKSSFIPDQLTSFEDDVHLGKSEAHKTLVNVSNVFKIKVEKAGAILKFSSQKNNGSVVVKVTDVDFKIEFNKQGLTFTDAVWSKLMGIIKDYIVDKIPEFTVSPAFLLSDKDILGFTLGLKNSNIEVNDSGLAISTDLVVNELEANTVAVPNYIVDTSLNVIHELTCDEVSKINQEHRDGYFVMYEALSKGYLPCKKCLKGYSLVGK